MLAPLAQDLREWRLLSGRPADTAPVIPGRDGGEWTEDGYADWIEDDYRPALAAATGTPAGEPETRRCPKCKAQPGRPCRTPGGRQARRPHVERRRPDADGSRPYALRHSFASLLIHEGRSVVYVARQLGHSTAVSMRTYQHVIDELEDAPRIPADEAIMAARRGEDVRSECAETS